jgi:hypothetical protein
MELFMKCIKCFTPIFTKRCDLRFGPQTNCSITLPTFHRAQKKIYPSIKSASNLAVWYIYFFFWHNGPQCARACPFTKFLDHTQRRTTVGRTPLDEGPACRRDLYMTTHNNHNRHAPGGIRTNNLNRRAVADLRLRPCGHWDRRFDIYIYIYIFIYLYLYYEEWTSIWRLKENNLSVCSVIYCYYWFLFIGPVRLFGVIFNVD